MRMLAVFEVRDQGRGLKITPVMGKVDFSQMRMADNQAIDFSCVDIQFTREIEKWMVRIDGDLQIDG